MNFAELELAPVDSFPAIAHGSGLDFATAKQAKDKMNGTVSFKRTVSDLLFHYNISKELTQGQFSLKRQAGITLGVLLQGKIQFALDDKETTLTVDKGAPPRCFAYNLATETLWRRRTFEDNHLIKIVVNIPHHWVTQKYSTRRDMGNVLSQLMRSHKEVWQCEASPKTQKLCDKAFKELEHELTDLETESLALSFIASLLQDTTPLLVLEKHSDRQGISQSAYNIFQYLESNIVKTNPPIQPDLKAIARQLGLSVSSAQRCFKQSYQQTIIEFVRNRRLEIAKEQLLQDMSIGEVAYLAGYKHSSNFALAFKKMFGITPGEVARPFE